MNGLQPDDVTLPRLLQRAGYRTIHVGKAHFGARGTPGADPTRLGFDVNVAGHAAGAPGSFLGTQDFSGAHRGGDRVWDVPGLEEWHGRDVYLTDVLAGEAVAAVRDAVAAERPFFLHFAPYAVHTPITANPAHLERYADLERREAAYATMIQTVDDALGRLLATLDELDVAERTIVVYTSDNGGLSAHGRDGEAHTHNAPLRSGKGSYLEGGVRIPQVVAWPGFTDGEGGARGGRVTDAPVITHDLFPTVLGWAGVELPAEHAPTVDGRDLRPLFGADGDARSASSTGTSRTTGASPVRASSPSPRSGAAPGSSSTATRTAGSSSTTWSATWARRATSRAPNPSTCASSRSG